MGSTHTSVYLSGQGVALREPTIVAFGADTKKIKAAGFAALNMMGKTPDKISLVAPVAGGIIQQPKIASQLLHEFILRLYPDSYILKPRVNAVVGIPAGLRREDCETYYDVFAAAGVNGNIYLAPKIMMAAVGLDLPVTSAQSSMVAILGGGTTEMAVMALSGILSSASWGITIGGEMMDRAICDYVAGRYNLKIGLTMARKAKETAGSLFENDMLAFRVRGMDLTAKIPGSAELTADEIREIIAPYYLRIADVVETAVNGCGPEISCDILRNGIYFAGGGARMPGLQELLVKRLDLKINIAESPEFSVIVGGGKLLKNRELLEDILS